MLILCNWYNRPNDSVCHQHILIPGTGFIQQSASAAALDLKSLQLSVPQIRPAAHSPLPTSQSPSPMLQGLLAVQQS